MILDLPTVSVKRGSAIHRPCLEKGDNGVSAEVKDRTGLLAPLVVAGRVEFGYADSVLRQLS